MKKLIILLVLANLFYLVYSMFSEPETTELVAFRGEKGLPLLVKLDELDGPPAVTSHVPLAVSAEAIAAKGESTDQELVAPVSDARVQALSTVAKPVTSASPDNASPAQGTVPAKQDAPVVVAQGKCLTVGPFTDLGVAKSARVSLENNEIAVKSRKELRQIKGAFWVYLPSYPDKETAQAASKVLAENGVKDYFIISEEDNKNGISLGLYNKRSFSDRRRGDIAKLGFKPLITSKERQREYWWLDLDTKKAVKVSDWKVDGVSDDIKLTQVECKT